MPKLESRMAYERLVELLLDGSLPEGAMLSERTLSESLGFGRTPVREAIRDLVREGVLESHPTRGSVVRRLTVLELQEIYEIRFALEGLAVQMAADRGAVDELLPYQERFEQVMNSSEPFDVKDIHDVGVDFHMKVVELSGNKELLNMYRPFRLRFRIPFGIVRQRRPERVLSAVTEHYRILQAIARHDTDVARELMHNHLKAGLDFRMKMLTTRTGPLTQLQG
ncbi:MAG: GntR family transcriptional regulator [Burkholderiaceae bacterium]